jgi:hypothetical protein
VHAIFVDDRGLGLGGRWIYEYGALYRSVVPAGPRAPSGLVNYVGLHASVFPNLARQPSLSFITSVASEGMYRYYCISAWPRKLIYSNLRRQCASLG